MSHRELFATKPHTVFFDLGNTLLEGTQHSPRRLLASRLDLTEKQTRVVGRLMMTLSCEEPAPFARAIQDLLPHRHPAPLRQTVEQFWGEQMAGVRVIEGAGVLLQWLKAQGCRVGIISNTWHPVYQGFCQMYPSMVEYFDYQFLSYRIGRKKPAVALYHTAVQATGEHPSRCWMVGDSYELDMEPALKAGMHALWVLCRPERERTTLVEILRNERPGPHWVVEGLQGVLPFFERVLG